MLLILVSFFNCALFLVFRVPRSFGGDFFLHLWLIRLQGQSWEAHHIPAMLVSFPPVGDLSVVPLFTGGFSYQLLGLINALGIPLYFCAVFAYFVVINYVSIQSFLLARHLGVSLILASLIFFIPFGFAWPIGDGFGRGGFSSMLAGFLIVASSLSALQYLMCERDHGRIVKSLSVLSFLIAATHLPSFVIYCAFSIPLINLCIFIQQGKRGIRTARVVNLSIAIGIMMGAMYWFPSILWSHSATFNNTDPFQPGVSSSFASPRNLWSFSRGVPSNHSDIWHSWIGDGFTKATSLVVTQPTVLVVFLVFLLAFVMTRINIQILLSFLLPLALIYTTIMYVPLWNVLPNALRSLQYTFRLLYVPIPFVVAAACFALKKFPLTKVGIFLATAFLCIVSVEVFQSFKQIANTTNLSYIKVQKDSPPSWQYDIPPTRVLDYWPVAPFWYAASEMMSEDDVLTEPVINKNCTEPHNLMNWGSWPANFRLRIPDTPNSCVAVPLRLPIDWISISSNLETIGRASNLDVIFKSDSGTKAKTVAISFHSPIYNGICISLIGLLVFLKEKRLASSQRRCTFEKFKSKKKKSFTNAAFTCRSRRFP